MGYPDPQGHYRRMGFAISWAQLVAAFGMAVAIYATRDPATDLRAVVQHIRRQVQELKIDETRIGLVALSANVAVALSALMQDHTLTCAALLYGYTMDLAGHTGVAEAAKALGFVNACAGKSVDDLPRGVPLFVVRAGRDQFTGLNDALDRFVLNALARNLPLTVVNHATGPHAFDLEDDTEISHEIMRRVLGFLQFHLRGGGDDGVAPRTGKQSPVSIDS
jgi:hypothetical protein